MKIFQIGQLVSFKMATPNFILSYDISLSANFSIISHLIILQVEVSCVDGEWQPVLLYKPLSNLFQNDICISPSNTLPKNAEFNSLRWIQDGCTWLLLGFCNWSKGIWNHWCCYIKTLVWSLICRAFLRWDIWNVIAVYVFSNSHSNNLASAAKWDVSG